MPAQAIAPARAVALVAACLALALPAAFSTAAAGATERAGAQSASASIVHGNPAPLGRFPWMAFVADVEGGSLCSGTAVSPWVVLTAAHCVYEGETLKSSSGFRVVTGVTDWSLPERQISEVTRIVPFPRYTHEVSGFGDAALLALSTPTTVPRIRLATGRNERLLRTGAKALIAGWGQTDFEQRDLTLGLLWTRLTLEGGRDCEGLRGRVCGIDFPKARSGACHGDSGGPLLARGRRGKGYLQIGVVQGGFGACSTQRPNLFLRADVIARWVNSRLKKLRPAP